MSGGQIAVGGTTGRDGVHGKLSPAEKAARQGGGQMVDWETIKNAYIATGISFRALERLYGVSHSAISKHAAREGWKTLRGQEEKVRPEENSVETENRAGRLCSAADRLLEKIITGIGDAPSLSPTDVKNYSGALKNIKEIQMIRRAEDTQEQRMKIEKLRKEIQKEAGSSCVTVILEGGAEAYVG